MSNNAIYTPKGKAREYAAFATNFYTGCSNQCDYCYLKRFPLLAANKPSLRKIFKSEAYALAAFNKELRDNHGNIPNNIRQAGVTFSFTTDPMLPECLELTAAAIRSCLDNDVPATILTKRTDWCESNIIRSVLTHSKAKHLLAIGFTITGLDNREPFANSNEMRISALKQFHEKGYITYVSVEPIFFYETALMVIRECAPYARLLKIGLNSNSHKCSIDTIKFINSVRNIVEEYGTKVYWKQSIRKCIGGGSPLGVNFVEADWNIFGR